MKGSVSGGTVLVCLVLATLAGAQKLSPKERRMTVKESLVGHPGLKYLDLEFCGTGSESQISRGPLGCGFPVAGDHPWLAALGFRSSRHGKITFSCAGALIGDQFVVTSAHCALGERDHTLVKVRLGEYDFGTTNDCLWYAPEQCLQAKDFDTADVIVHPKFKPSAWQGPGSPDPYDIGLIRLRKPAVMSLGISSICLPIYPKRAPPRSQRAIAFNLQSSAPLTDSSAHCCNCSRERGATSHVMDAVQLQKYNETYSGEEPCRYWLQAEQAGQPNTCLGAGDACMADRGGPMVSADRFGGAYYVLGIATDVPSEKACKAKKDAAVVYTPVEPHTEWLLTAMNDVMGGKSRPF